MGPEKREPPCGGDDGDDDRRFWHVHDDVHVRDDVHGDVHVRVEQQRQVRWQQQQERMQWRVWFEPFFWVMKYKRERI